MRLNKRLIVVAALAAASCEQPKPEPVYGTINENLSAKLGNEHSERLANMDPQMRRIMFYRLLRNSGIACEGVTDTMLLGSHQKTAIWNVRCLESGDFMVSIASDSSTSIARCSDIALTGDKCWMAFEKVTTRTLLPP